MQEITVNVITSPHKDKIITPDFIYNRIDLFSSNYEILEIKNNITYYVEVDYKKTEAILGVWLVDIPVEVIEKIAEFIFNTHKNIRTIRYEYGYCKIGVATQKNHFRIELPDTEQELKSRLSSKGRYNIKREKRILEDTFGGYEIKEYSNSNVPEDVINSYFSMKKATHDTDYHMTCAEYLQNYHVTDIYVLYLKGSAAAILLSCEQCSVVYIENLTYDLNYSKYSLGQILYDIYLSRLIEKHKRQIFLAGGNLEYKKRYGSVEEETYNCIIFRSKIEEFLYKTKVALRKEVKKVKGDLNGK